MSRRPRAGVTLMEVLIAVTLLSLLAVGMLYSMRVGLMAFSKVDTRLMQNRRAAGAQRVVESEIAGMIPVVTPCGSGKILFFQGEPQTMRLISTFSLQEGWRGQPQILELFVIPGENGQGVRLVVNETPYEGPLSASHVCTGDGKFAPVTAGPNSFVLADKLASCQFQYLGAADNPRDPPLWQPLFKSKLWPFGVRIQMTPLEPDPSRLQPLTATVPLFLYRNPEMQYED